MTIGIAHQVSVITTIAPIMLGWEWTTRTATLQKNMHLVNGCLQEVDAPFLIVMIVCTALEMVTFLVKNLPVFYFSITK